eukprot:2743650-Pleurochrysis_carterae.AAC.1
MAAPRVCGCSVAVIGGAALPHRRWAIPRPGGGGVAVPPSRVRVGVSNHRPPVGRRAAGAD